MQYSVDYLRHINFLSLAMNYKNFSHLGALKMNFTSCYSNTICPDYNTMPDC